LKVKINREIDKGGRKFPKLYGVTRKKVYAGKEIKDPKTN